MKFSPIKTFGLFLACSFFALGSATEWGFAQEFASEQRRDSALGHYARSRSLLVEALREFEEGRKLARPDLLIDPEEWRIAIISKTEELNRILDPRPRVTSSGVRFRANTRIVKPGKHRGEGEAAISNTIGEEQMAREVARGEKKSEDISTQSGAPAADPYDIPEKYYEENKNEIDDAKNLKENDIIEPDIEEDPAVAEAIDELIEKRAHFVEEGNNDVEVSVDAESSKIEEKVQGPTVDDLFGE